TEDDGTRAEDMKAHIGADINEQLSLKANVGANHSKAELDDFASDAPGYSTAVTYYGITEAKYKMLGGKLQNTARLSHYVQNRKSNEPLGFYRFSTFDGERTQASLQS